LSAGLVDPTVCGSTVLFGAPGSLVGNVLAIS
jgi:hypothetical protein